MLWPVAYLRDSLHGSSLILCAVQNLLGAPLLGISLGIKPGHGCPTMFPFPGSSRKIHRQFSWSSASEQSRAVAAAITQSQGQAEAGEAPGLVLSHSELIFGPCSEHRRQHEAAHVEMQLQALAAPCWAFTDQNLPFCQCWSHTQTCVSNWAGLPTYFQCF